MAESSAVSGQPQNRATPIDEIDVLWLTAGLGCDGDTIAVTGATQPSIEDLGLGTFPSIPKARFHNPFLAYENGDEFVNFLRVLRVSARTGEGMNEFLEFFETKRSHSRAAAAV